jgi:predicted AlkP superfamily phosphohydrolase/phosphomutase
VGLEGLFTEGGGLGPDACNHDWDGIFVMAGGGSPARGETTKLAIYDICRTVLGVMGVEGPDDLLGVDRGA